MNQHSARYALQWGRARRRGRTWRFHGRSYGLIARLQWGRARRRGRTPENRRGLPLQNMLQWGRARRRGRTLIGGTDGSAVSSFNGAAPEGAEERSGSPMRPTNTKLQWGRARRRGRTVVRVSMSEFFTERFNGAAPEGAEELSGGSQAVGVDHTLQWGRARRRGRTYPSRWGGCWRGRAASMGPRPKARKNVLVWRAVQAARRLQWGRARRRGRTDSFRERAHWVPWASMGPRPKARKNA